MADLYTLGNFTIDDIVLHDGRNWMDQPGGNALYSALGAQVWVKSVGLIARLGHDLPPHYLSTLSTLDLDLRLIPVATPNLHNWVLYEPDGRRQIINHRGSDLNDAVSLRANEIPPSCLNARAFHIASMPAERQAELVHALKHRERLLSLDPHDLFIKGNEELLFGLLPLVDFFLPSREEARMLYGKDDPEHAVLAFAGAGPRAAVVKLGAEGSLVFDAASQKMTHVPSYPANVVDETGAGDTYCGGFLAGYLETRDALTAACCGTVSASFCIEHLGVLPSTRPTRAEAEERCAIVRERVKHRGSDAWIYADSDR